MAQKTLIAVSEQRIKKNILCLFTVSNRKASLEPFRDWNNTTSAICSSQAHVVIRKCSQSS